MGDAQARGPQAYRFDPRTMDTAADKLLAFTTKAIEPPTVSGVLVLLRPPNAGHGGYGHHAIAARFSDVQRVGRRRCQTDVPVTAFGARWRRPSRGSPAEAESQT